MPDKSVTLKDDSAAHEVYSPAGILFYDTVTQKDYRGKEQEEE